MTEVTSHRFRARDDVELHWHELVPTNGAGRPLLLLHGLFSNAQTNWVKFGTAQRLAEAGHRCLMLDLRAHGDSDAPTDPAAYPANILARDVMDWIAHLDIDDYDLAGFSLGGRTAAQAVLLGATPRRLAICGMGLRGLVDHRDGTDWFLEVIANRDDHDRGSDAYFAVQFMKTNAVDPVAAALLLRAQVDTDPEQLAAISIPTTVLCGDEDTHRDEAVKLSDVMPSAHFVAMPGTHMSSVTKPEFGSLLAAAFGGD